MAFQKFYAILNVTHERFGDAKGGVCRQDCSQSIKCRLHILTVRGVISLTLSLLISLVTRSNMILGMRTGRTALVANRYFLVLPPRCRWGNAVRRWASPHCRNTTRVLGLWLAVIWSFNWWFVNVNVITEYGAVVARDHCSYCCGC